MVEQVTFQTIFQFLQTVGILVGVYYYIMTIRTNQRNQELQLETRQAQLFIQIYNRFQEVEFRNNFNDVLSREWEDYDDYVKKYGRFTNPTAQAKSSSIALFFEGLGVILMQGLLEIDIVGELMSSPVRLYWEKMKPILMVMRERMDRDSIMASAEYLYDEIVRRDLRLGRISKEVYEPYQDIENV
jgi:hypothetical protein